MLVFLFSYILLVKSMLFIKGLIIGIGKVMPGVSGALLAINFKVYDRLVESLVNFFSDWKKNLRFLLELGSGIIIAIILFSNGIRYLLNNYNFLMVMLFMGLIGGGSYNYIRSVNYEKKEYKYILFIIGVLIGISFIGKGDNYVISNSFKDNIVFFLGGVIEVFTSIIPGISGTAIMMIMGIYDMVLMIVGRIYDFSYVISNINIYISYGLGIIISFILGTLLINYLLKKKKKLMEIMIGSFSIYSIFMMGVMTFSKRVSVIEIILGILLMVVGTVIGFIMDGDG